MVKTITLVAGDKFNMLSVIELHHTQKYFSPCGALYNQQYYLCKCDCGRTNIIEKNQLRRGKVKSCGCLLLNNKRIHGISKHKLFRVYHGMVNRCTNPRNISYPNYGARGIRVCDLWANKGIREFYSWAIENGYKDGLSIDRINNDGNYEPSNCRWVDRSVQNRNTRANRIISFNNESLCLIEWSEKLNIHRRTLSSRLNRGISIGDIINNKQKQKLCKN